MTTPVATIDSTGISVPDFATALAYVQGLYQAAFGNDAYIDPDSQDGQWIGNIASAISDSNEMAAAVFNQFSPSTSQGAGLASVVKINGLSKLASSQSTADVTLVGQVGTQITNGQVGDSQQQNTTWDLPALVTIPISGQITVTATCTQQGAIVAPAHTLTQILTPTRGWQTSDNALAATPGAPVEIDATLRMRQAASTNQVAQTPVSALQGALTNLAGVQRLRIYENDTDVPDGNGVKAHTLAIVIEGGDATQICQTIALKKMPGGGTQGTVTQVVVDQNGAPKPISFYPLTVVPITVAITIKALPGYISTTGAQIVADVASWISGLGIGAEVYWAKLFGPAGLNNVALGNTFNVQSITLSRDGNPLAPADVVISFIEAASCDAAHVALTVTS